jgi:two-component system, NarL family, response regulator LiaR
VAIRLLIADDHPVVRRGLRQFMGLDASVEVLEEEARTGQEAVQVARRARPDVILMDLEMPTMDGITATGIIHTDLPGIAVIALSSGLDAASDSSVLAALRAGAVGFVDKTSDASELRRAVHAAAAGEVQLSPTAAKRLVHQLTNPAPVASLTARETQVLELLAKGLVNKEIAVELRIGQQTVKTYVSNILAKLGVRSRTEAALYAVASGLIPRPKHELAA